MPSRKIVLAASVSILLGAAALAWYLPLTETYTSSFTYWVAFLAVGYIGLPLLLKQDEVVQEVRVLFFNDEDLGDTFRFEDGENITLGQWYKLPWGSRFMVFDNPVKGWAWVIDFRFRVEGSPGQFSGDFKIPDEWGAVFVLTPEGIQKMEVET